MSTKPRSVGASVPARPRFAVSRPTNPALVFAPMLPPILGLVGALILVAAAPDREPDLVKVWGLKDPARTEAPRLTIAFAQKHSIGVFKATVETRNSKPDLEIEFKTLDWGVHFQGANTYSIGYEAELTMIDNRIARVVAHGKCRARLAPVHTYVEVAENEDNFLREELKSAGRQCARDLGTRLLGVAAD